MPLRMAACRSMHTSIILRSDTLCTIVVSCILHTYIWLSSYYHVSCRHAEQYRILARLEETHRPRRPSAQQTSNDNKENRAFLFSSSIVITICIKYFPSGRLQLLLLYTTTHIAATTIYTMLSEWIKMMVHTSTQVKYQNICIEDSWYMHQISQKLLQLL